MTRRRCIFNLVQKYNAGHNYLSTWKDNHLLIIIRERELGGFATTATRMFHMHIFIFTKKSFFFHNGAITAETNHNTELEVSACDELHPDEMRPVDWDDAGIHFGKLLNIFF